MLSLKDKTIFNSAFVDKKNSIKIELKFNVWNNYFEKL